MIASQLNIFSKPKYLKDKSFKSFGSNKTKWPKEDSQNGLRLPLYERGEH
jgi:hypothetical protein